MISGYFIYILFTIIAVIINDPLERTYISIMVFYSISLGYYLRALPLFVSSHRKFIFILLYIDVIVKLALTNEWNESIIFIVTIEVFL